MTTTDLLLKLVGFPTPSADHIANREALDFIEQFLTTRGMHVTRLENGGFESLIATTRPTKTPTIFLAGHLDVVPAPPELFEPRLENGRIYGRGVLDMKFAIASYLHLVDKLKADLTSYDFGLMITTDEEVSGEFGSALLAEQGYLPKVLLLPDGGDNWKIEQSAKGFWGGKLVARGKSAHGSRPWEGESASEKLHDALADFRALFPERNHDSNTYNIGMIHGGEAPNQVPNYMEAQIEFRAVSNEEYARLEQAVADICTRHGIDFELLRSGSVVVTDLTNPFVQQFRELLAQHTGVSETMRSMGASDARFFTEKGVPCILVCPPGGGRHAADEWIDAESVETFTQIVQEFVQTAAHTQA